VERTLLSDQFLERGIFNADTVRRCVAQHEAKQRNHTYLIMALLIYEIGQRQLFSGGKSMSDITGSPSSAH
jgi:hypothetical protein